MSESWVLKAIEREALERARIELANCQFSIFGLRPEQVLALRYFFMDHTGVDPQRVSPDGIKETPLKFGTRDFQRQCKGKVKYTGEGLATVAKLKLHGMSDHFGVYECPHCKSWHIGHTQAGFEAMRPK